MQNINAQAQFNACAAGDAAAVSRLLPAGGPPRNLSGPRFQQGDIKSTALIAAAAFGHTEIVQMILAPNTDVNYANAMGDTALIMAAQYHHADILRLLADRGASLIFTGQRRFTHRGGDSRIEGPGGFTPLHLAVAPIRPGEPRRNPDPDGARQIASVRALLRLSAGT
jgi:ankyrin repeat protein